MRSREKMPVVNQVQKDVYSFAAVAFKRILCHLKKNNLSLKLIFNSLYTSYFARASVCMRLLLP